MCVFIGENTGDSIKVSGIWVPVSIDVSQKQQKLIIFEKGIEKYKNYLLYNVKLTLLEKAFIMYHYFTVNSWNFNEVKKNEKWK